MFHYPRNTSQYYLLWSFLPGKWTGPEKPKGSHPCLQLSKILFKSCSECDFTTMEHFDICTWNSSLGLPKSLPLQHKPIVNLALGQGESLASFILQKRGSIKDITASSSSEPLQQGQLGDGLQAGDLLSTARGWARARPMARRASPERTQAHKSYKVEQQNGEQWISALQCSFK